MGFFPEGMDYTLTVADIISHARKTGAFDPSSLSGAEPVRRIVGRNGSKADVLFFDLGDERVAVKTYAPRGTVVRNTLGRWLIRRETAAYEAAEGVDALPAFLGRLGPHALATRWVDAEPLRERAGARLDDALFDRLGVVLDELHSRGVALADLHHRDVLLGADDSLYIVDLATAWVLGRRSGPIRRRLFERFCESDRVNLARMRARFTGGDADAAVASVSPAAEAWHRRGRKLKGYLNRLRGKR
jgi:tRNA A-37 threonylcarbamoyl transferase component Bud32